MKKKKADGILLGVVADDFTGASDAASFLAGQGIRTLLFNGVPSAEKLPDSCSAVVIATKTRSIEANAAVEEATNAFKWLKAAGAKQFYYKYCSTFDSTPKGNIGPIADAALELFGVNTSILCPSLPVNGRTVRDGVLYVNGEPLAESPMKNHPLNPMWASRIDELMQPQSQYPCLILGHDVLFGAAEAEIKKFAENNPRFYVVPDYTTDEEGRKIAELFGDAVFLTGGSGILAHLADRMKAEYELPGAEHGADGTSGKAVLIAGSCSKATNAQIHRYLKIGVGVPVYVDRLQSGADTSESLWAKADLNAAAPLFYSAGSADPSLRIYKTEQEQAAAGALLEKTFAEIARLASNAGVTRFIIAGGETSGAVALELGFDGYLIGESIAPGVPVMTPLNSKTVRVAYKSGNFGDDYFFEKALKMTEEN